MISWSRLVGTLPENSQARTFCSKGGLYGVGRPARSCVVGTLPENSQVIWLFTMSWSDFLKFPGWHFAGEFSGKDFLFKGGLYGVGRPARSCVVCTLPENSQGNLWFVMSWRDYLKLPRCHFTWEFSSKSMVYDVLKWWLEVAWLTLYLRILK